MGWFKAQVEKVVTAVLLVLPFFLWGTNMVVMEDVMPRTGAMFMAAARLVPAGALILAFAMSVATDLTLCIIVHDCADF